MTRVGRRQPFLSGNHGFLCNAENGYHYVMNKSDTIVVFFSRAGENFKVGNVAVGSAEILANLVAEKTGAALYRIVPEKPYPTDLLECNKVAREELQTNARPAIRKPLPDMSSYRNIFLVFPNWWGDLPKPVYTFLDTIETEGLTFFPIGTHEDTGLAMIDRMLSQAYPKAKFIKGIAIKGTVVQSDEAKTEEIIEKYLSDIR